MQTLTLITNPRPSYIELTPEELAAAMRAVPGWRGDILRIRRTVAPHDLWGLFERVAAAEAELDHHSVVDLDAGAVTFALWTHALGKVTGTDLALALRINEAIDAA